MKKNYTFSSSQYPSGREHGFSVRKSCFWQHKQKEGITSIIKGDAEPIIFRERGIEFMLFPNGEFDFNTRPSGPRYAVNGTNGAPGTRGYYGTSEEEFELSMITLVE